MPEINEPLRQVIFERLQADLPEYARTQIFPLTGTVAAIAAIAAQDYFNSKSGEDETEEDSKQAD